MSKRVFVEMKKDALGTDVNDDGVSMGQRKYMSGQIYDLNERLAKDFLSQEVGFEVKERSKKEQVSEPAPAEGKARPKKAKTAKK